MSDSKTVKRPKCCKDEHLEYLDELSKAGETNMFGPWADLMDDCELKESDAKAIHSYWMKTFGKDER